MICNNDPFIYLHDWPFKEKQTTVWFIDIGREIVWPLDENTYHYKYIFFGHLLEFPFDIKIKMIFFGLLEF